MDLKKYLKFLGIVRFPLMLGLAYFTTRSFTEFGLPSDYMKAVVAPVITTPLLALGAVVVIVSAMLNVHVGQGFSGNLDSKALVRGPEAIVRLLGFCMLTFICAASYAAGDFVEASFYFLCISGMTSLTEALYVALDMLRAMACLRVRFEGQPRVLLIQGETSTTAVFVPLNVVTQGVNPQHSLAMLEEALDVYLSEPLWSGPVGKADPETSRRWSTEGDLYLGSYLNWDIRVVSDAQTNLPAA